MKMWYFSLLNMLHCLVWLDSPLVLLRNSSSGKILVISDLVTDVTYLVHSFGQRPIYSGYLLTFPLVFALVLPSVTKTVLLLCKHVQLCGQKWRIVRGEGTLTAQQKFHTNQQNTELTMLNKTQHTHKEQKPE